jgi:hypothetical protein
MLVLPSPAGTCVERLTSFGCDTYMTPFATTGALELLSVRHVMIHFTDRLSTLPA